jgi:glycosyltransferase involved in cell wall biosynthesis
MRITFVLPDANFSGGVRVVATYAQKLTQRGHDVVVVSTPPPPGSLKRKVWHAVKLAGGWRPRAGGSHLDGTGVRHHTIERFRPVVDADVPDADVVVATWWETAEWVWKLSPEKGAKAYFLQHYEVWGGAPERVDATWRLPIHKIVISRWLERMGSEKFGITDASYVPNAVDLEQFRAPARGKQQTPTVGIIYSDIPFKGYEVGLRAIEQIRASMPGVKVRSFGLTNPWDTLPLPPGCEYVRLPPQAKIPEVYAGCDVWLYTSRSEGFGLPVLEAMACRTPVVGTPAGAAPELIGDGGGILVPFDDPTAMAQAALKVLRMPGDQWKAMSDQAHRTATSYTWDDAAKRMEEALETAIVTGQRPHEVATA